MIAIDTKTLSWLLGAGSLVTVLLLYAAVGEDIEATLKRRLQRVSSQTVVKKINIHDRQRVLKESRDSTIPFLDRLVKLLPNPDKLRNRLGRTGYNLSLGEYFLINMLIVGVMILLCHVIGVVTLVELPSVFAVGFGLPHFIIGVMGTRRIRKFLASFPEAIDTMTRGIRSGLPVTESIAAVGREMPDPVGLEFRRIADGVRLGKTLEATMWEITRRIDTPEFRFLIIAMAIQRETGGNLAETLSNLSELIRRRRQLRLKIKAMSSEARASAMIIGSLPFIMFVLLMIVNKDYILSMFHSSGGKFALGAGLTWMSIGWMTMNKMIKFEI